MATWSFSRLPPPPLLRQTTDFLSLEGASIRCVPEGVPLFGQYLPARYRSRFQRRCFECAYLCSDHAGFTPASNCRRKFRTH